MTTQKSSSALAVHPDNLREALELEVPNNWPFSARHFFSVLRAEVRRLQALERDALRANVLRVVTAWRSGTQDASTAMGHLLTLINGDAARERT